MQRILKFVMLFSAASFALGASPCEAGLFDWLWGPQPARYAPTEVGYYPSGAYYGAGPAATHYSTNYGPSNYAPSSYTTNYSPSYAGGIPPTTNRAPAVHYPYNYTTNYAPNYSAGYAPSAPSSQPAYRAPLNGYYQAPTTTFYRAPRTTYYRAPTTSYYQPPSNSTYYRGAPARSTYYRGPLGLFNWQNACGGLTPCRPYASTTTNYRPRTTFRPVWQRVPVTYFRPVSQVDPVTGQAIQQMQPCTTYRWQIQQRPAMFPSLRRRPVAMQGGEVWCDPSGVPSAPAATGRTDDPYYNRTRIIRPGEGGLVPRDSNIPRGAEIIREETLDPDERRPRLQSEPPVGGGLGAAPRRGIENVSSSPTSSTRTSGPETRHDVAKPKTTRPERSSLIPDPEADSIGYPEPPKLIKPRDKTALAPSPRFQSVSYEAAWPASAKPIVRRVKRVQNHSDRDDSTPKSLRPATRRLDDSGWRSIR